MKTINRRIAKLFKIRTQKDNIEELKMELYTLTEVERVRELDTTESNRYLYLWEQLKANNVDIDFGVEI